MKKWLLAVLIIAITFIISISGKAEKGPDVNGYLKDTTPLQSWNRDSIIKELRKELTDTNISEMAKQIINTLEESKKDTFALFPFHSFDSVTLAILEPWKNNKKQDILSSKRLDTLQVKNLLILCNNPLYYNWAECGTQLPEARAYFYHNGTEIASITFACGLGQLAFSPDNILSRFGALNNNADIIVNSLGF